MKRRREQRNRQPNLCKTTTGTFPLLLVLAGLCLGWPAEWRTSQVMAQISADQASSAISMLMKPNQESACDGEQLEIKCNDDYVIEIITTELTILARELHATTPKQQQDNKVTNASDTRTNPGAGERNATRVGNQTATHAVEPANSGTATTVGNASAATAICAPLKSAGNNYEWVGGASGTGSEEACDEQRAGELSAESQARVLLLIRKQCSLLKSCSLDLSPGNTTTTIGSGTGDAAAAAAGSLGQLLANGRACPRNRKLLELAYKCRPSRVKSRSACRNQKLQLECAEPNKRIALGSAAYGFWLEDKKTNERCAQEEERASSRGADWTAARPTVQLYKSSCSTGGGGGQQATFGAIARECLFKRQCQVPVDRPVFSAFESSCNNLSTQRLNGPAATGGAGGGYLEYLKVIYVCVSEELLVTTNSSLILRQLSPNSGKTSDVAASANVSPSSLLQQAASTVQPQSQANLQVVEGLATQAPRFDLANGEQRHNQQEDEIQAETSMHTLEVLAGDPHLATVHPSHWTAWQRVKFVLLRYQNHLVAFAVITIAISTLLAFVTRLVCAAGSRRSTTSNASSTGSSAGSTQKSMFGGSNGTGSGKGSSSSTSSTASSNSTSSSNFANQTTATVASQQLLGAGLQHLSHFAGHQNHNHNHLLTTANHYSKPPQITLNTGAGAGRAPTNSCSESCFSLEDFNNPNQQHSHHHHHHQHKQVAFQVDNDRPTPPTLRGGGGDSPALQSQQTATPPCGDQGSLLNYQQDHHLQQVAGGATATVARPKLWSFYGNEQHSNSLRLGAGGALQQQLQQHQQVGGGGGGGSQLAATLRPQRTFMGQLQQQHQPTLARNFQCLQPNQEIPQPLEPHQSDYLLAMASVTQQHHLHSQDQSELADEPSAAHLQPPQLRLLSLNPADLQQQQQAPNQTCAFHSQQSAQQMFSAQEQPPLHNFDHQHPHLMGQHNHPHR